MNSKEEIDTLFHNSYGVAFRLRRGSLKEVLKIELVFRDTGLSLDHQELSVFSKHITATIENAPLCQNCSADKNCRALLLRTPIRQVSFAMSLKELRLLLELVDGTLFQLGLDKLLRAI